MGKYFFGICDPLAELDGKWIDNEKMLEEDGDEYDHDPGNYHLAGRLSGVAAALSRQRT